MPQTKTPTLDIVRRIVGRRHRISRDEMALILQELHSAGLDLCNGYVAGTCRDDPQYDHTPWWRWVAICRGTTVVSVDRRGLRDGSVRYDQPGRMHPLQHAELSFAPAALERMEYDQIGQLRRYAERVLVVTGEPKPDPDDETAEPETGTVECDNGHRWETDDLERDWRCPTCGEGWV